MIERIEELRVEGEAAILAAADTAALEEVRIRFLGRKADLPQMLRQVSELPPEQRSQVGSLANKTRKGLEEAINARQTELERAELDRKLVTDVVDVTLPGSPAHPLGGLHLLTSTRRDIEDVFLGLGYKIAEGPEIELVYYNFDALNHDPKHPARLWTDTFYVNDDVLLRTHTSPVQIRSMEIQPPPLNVIVPGRVYRRDADATHTPQFHQVEGLAVDEDITLADLQGTLLAMTQALFGEDRAVRLRPHFFPFTEPSVEVDVSCFNCKKGFLKDGSRCALCKGTAWIELLGAGMIDPNVFEYVRGSGYDPERVQGFAFGMGIERAAMLKHGVPDLRLLYENDVRFLRTFA